MEKMTAFTDSEYTYLHELDLDGIKEMQTVAIKQENDMVTRVNVEYCVSVAKQVPALIAEVERLREENKLFENVVELSEKRRQASEEENARLREALETSEESSKVRYILLEDARENIEHLKYVLDMVKIKVSSFGQLSTTKAWNARHAKGILEFIDHELEEGEPDE